MNFGPAIEDVLRYAKTLPILSPEETIVEARVIQRYLAEEKPSHRLTYHYRRSKHKLISHNLRLIVRLVVRYRSLLTSSFDPDDAFMSGLDGLDKAADRFDPKRGYRFSTYANGWIRQSVLRDIQNNANTIRTPTHAQQLYSDYKKWKGTHPKADKSFHLWLIEQKRYRSGQYTNFEAAVGLTYRAMSANFNSIDQPYGKDENGTAKVIDFCADDLDLAGSVYDQHDDNERLTHLREVMRETLSRDECAVLQLVYVQGLKMGEAASVLNLSITKVKDRARKAIGKLREVMVAA